MFAVRIFYAFTCGVISFCTRQVNKKCKFCTKYCYICAIFYLIIFTLS